MEKKAIIICGGLIEEDFVLATIKAHEPDCVIAVDKGLEFLHRHKIRPDAIVGDFDSVNENVISYYVREKAICIYQHDANKENSDTELAMEVAIELNQKDLLILGATGNRLDHFWGNVQSMKIPLDNGIKSMIVDSKNKIRLLDKDFVIKKEECFGNYFSLFPLGEPAKNVSVEGAKYPLKNETLTPWCSRCISNEIVDEELRITFSSGIVILMETKD
jgi:thiamine pyrophosphokinase